MHFSFTIERNWDKKGREGGGPEVKLRICVSYFSASDILNVKLLKFRTVSVQHMNKDVNTQTASPRAMVKVKKVRSDEEYRH